MKKPSFVVIDFETANWMQIPCQVGIVTCINGEIVDRYQSLISLPRGVFIHPKFTEIHKITNKDLIGQPNFQQVLPIIREKLTQGYIVIAHNAGFDMSVLKRALRLHDISPFMFDYACSVDLIRSSFPGRFSKHGLGVLAKELGITFNHHDALADSEATSKVLLKCFNNDTSFNLALNSSKTRIKRFKELYDK
ncbi:DNA polymerase III subunit epsilon [Spiroplasma corruscae]|uniref:DNA polymerase III subunit epsilon n=1 Tax=Spiroplasma corruscae TaxID=216934 RepID=A0A222EPD6_9MOLU|nr:exonuclease domain-containing protein [Spiroplasma corruscae]ASP28346.1 DNA polymerase III subunit epsilon [Spiroplasma corruscae]